MTKPAKEPSLEDIAGTIECGLSFLAKQQEADGSFISYSSINLRPFRQIREWHTTFVPALMLASLSGLEHERALDIRQRLAKFLLAQKNDTWSFNYWSRGAPEYRSMPYPDDLDDTFCALAALQLHDPSIVNMSVVATALKLLLATESAVGGPYRTWLVPPDSETIWRDVDIAVNSNVAYFLSLIGTRLPKLDNLMRQAIEEDRFVSPYYPLPFAFIYFFARAYQGAEEGRLLQKARQLHKEAGAALDKALCLIARLRLGDTAADLTAAVRELIDLQRRDGSWPAAALYADPVKNGKLRYNGASALTTAFVLEALQHYKEVSSLPAVRQKSTSFERSESKHHQATLSLAKAQCASLGKEARATTLDALQKLARGSNGREIIDLAVRFNDSLKRPLTKRQTDALTGLSLGNLYGWLAYTIYDDFLDGDGQAKLLPTANIALRRSLACFKQAASGQTEFQKYIEHIFDVIDGANAWELTNCRWKRQKDQIEITHWPDYGDLSKLAERSLGHSLAPLAILVIQGKAPADSDFQKLQQAFTHYLIARQLNDDCHDWEDDLANGQATYVVVTLLRETGIQLGRHTLSSLTQKARRQFWHETLPQICAEMHRQIHESRRALSEISALKNYTVVGELLDGIQQSVDDTLSQQAQAIEFLKHYQYPAKKP